MQFLIHYKILYLIILNSFFWQVSAQNDQSEKMNKANQFPEEMPGVGHNKILNKRPKDKCHICLVDIQRQI